MFPEFILSQLIDLEQDRLSDSNRVERRLSDLRECFVDRDSFEHELQNGDALLYTVASFDRPDGAGDLHCGLGVLQPGKIGEEYFMTKGHLHSWRKAAEIYICLSGCGLMLLEDEGSGVSRSEPLTENSIVYVPGHTLHRTINIGSTPLKYLGIYPAQAGHDYGSIATRNFKMVVVEREGTPAMLPRVEYIKQL